MSTFCVFYHTMQRNRRQVPSKVPSSAYYVRSAWLKHCCPSPLRCGANPFILGRLILTLTFRLRLSLCLTGLMNHGWRCPKLCCCHGMGSHGMAWHGPAWQDLFGGEGVLVKMATAPTEPIRIRTEVSEGFAPWYPMHLSLIHI